MVIDTKKESLCINQSIGKKEVTVNVEGDIIIPDVKPDILNSISTSGNVCIYKKEVLDGKIRIDGSVNIFVMYMPDGESNCVRGLNTSLDFTEVIDLDGAKSGMNSEEEIEIKVIECRVLNGRKINIRATLQLKTMLYSSQNISLIQEINNYDDMQILSKLTNISSLVGSGNTKINAKDTIHLDETDNLLEILKTEINITNKETKVSYNKILAKADLNVKILYLTEDNRICNVKAQIPVMGFIDIANVNEENICDIKYIIKNIILKPNNTEENSIYVEVELEINCFVYENKEIKIIKDLYSPKDNVVFTKKNINAMLGKNSINGICEINEKIQIPDLGNNRVYDVNIKPYILNQKIINGKIVYEGEVELNIIYEANNIINLDSKKLKINFNYSMDAQGLSNSNNILTNLEIKESNFVVQGDGNVDCKIQIEMQADLSNTSQIDIIDEINTEENERTYKNYSMVIYFVKKGDTLWNIAKKFKSTVEDIVKVNDIADESKIYPAMQLFIPKYSLKKIV